MNENYCVYKHTAPNGKVYIGITSKNPLVRWNNGYGYFNQPYFWNAIVKHGWDNIKHEILFTGLTEDEAGAKERELIAEYDSTNPTKGYNISPGGSKGHLGIKRSAETREKLSRSNIRRWETMDTKRRQEEAERCRHMFEGHKHTEKSKSQCMLNNPKRKMIVQFDIKGNIIAEYNSIREAERKNNIKHPSVSNCITGKSKSAGGYLWKEKIIKE